MARPVPRALPALSSPLPQGRERQGEGLSDPVMAASVSKGQMVFPGVSELMAAAGERAIASPKWGHFILENVRAAWPRAAVLRNICSAHSLELAPGSHQLAAHLRPQASLQVAVKVVIR